MPYNTAKCDCGRGSARTRMGELTAAPDLLAGFKGAALRRGEGGEGREGEERGGEGKERRGAGREGRGG